MVEHNDEVWGWLLLVEQFSRKPRGLSRQQPEVGAQGSPQHTWRGNPLSEKYTQGINGKNQVQWELPKSKSGRLWGDTSCSIWSSCRVWKRGCNRKVPEALRRLKGDLDKRPVTLATRSSCLCVPVDAKQQARGLFMNPCPKTWMPNKA